MQNAGIDEVTARAKDNAEKMNIPTNCQRRDEGIDLTPQHKFSNECVEVYGVIFGLIQWRFEKLREV